VAVIAIEVTGSIRLLFPSLLVAVVACGVTKRLGRSLYEDVMINKGPNRALFDRLLFVSESDFHRSKSF
jgi:H+/Cl- antiporter ClcA